MLFRKGQYINLKDQPEPFGDGAEKQYRLFSPLVQLSKPSRGKSWKGSRWILIQKGRESERTSLFDLSSLLRALVYGISFVVFTIGNLFRGHGSGGQYNGGQA